MRTTLIAALLACVAASVQAGSLPRGFVDAKSVIPDLIVEMRYAGAQNFMGRPVPGYQAPRCILTRRAASALKCAADRLRDAGYAIKAYDCYRPQRAVNAFVRWGRDLRDQKMKSAYYPEVDKRRLFSDGYIAPRSGHSRGSTIDLSIVPLDQEGGQPASTPEGAIRACDSDEGRRTDDGSADMGTGFDCFSRRSHTASPAITGEPRRNREILRGAMRQCGFINYRNEWWHYTLAGEPYPDAYFDFPVE
jgi:D-alanyl-D-alanine dipeptidase